MFLKFICSNQNQENQKNNNNKKHDRFLSLRNKLIHRTQTLQTAHKTQTDWMLNQAEELRYMAQKEIENICDEYNNKNKRI